MSCGRGICTFVSSSIARALASAFDTLRCSMTVRMICVPIVCTGDSAVIGSWKTMPISPPRRVRMVRLWRCSAEISTSLPSLRRNRTLPPASTALAAVSRMIERAVTDLPEPLSPTMPSTSPLSTW